MTQKIRVTFTEINSSGDREFRHYSMPSLEAAKMALRMAIEELERVKEVYPNMVYIEYWDEEQEEWLFWVSDDGRDTIEFVFGDDEY